MPRHHLVPQSLLGNFANENRQLVMVPRAGGGPRLTSVRKACAEAGFYEIEVNEAYRGKVDREHVETLLSQVEGTAKGHLESLVGGNFPLSDHDRFDLALFLALQFTRGWSFRQDLVELANHGARLHAKTVSEEEIRQWLRQRGDATDERSVRALHQRVRSFEGVRVVPSQSETVRQMLKFALEETVPCLYSKRWRLILFDQPCLLISDQPVGLWGRPMRDLDRQPLGLATADAVWFPIDRRTALGLLNTGDEKVSVGTAARARHVNRAVAAGAQRWIFHHPADDPLDGLELPAPSQFVDEIESTVVEGDMIRERHRFVKK